MNAVLDDDRVGRSRHRRRDAEVDATRAASSAMASSAMDGVSRRWAVDGYLSDRTRFEYDGLYSILGTWTSMYVSIVSIVGKVALSQH